jgi:hypothetical protein
MSTIIQTTKSHFYIDDSKIYEGYTAGNTWNGWACPYFTKEVALNILKAMADAGDIAEYSYDEVTDEIKYTFANEEPESERGVMIRYGKDSLKAYGLGSFAWVWCDVKWDDQWGKTVLQQFNNRTNG